MAFTTPCFVRVEDAAERKKLIEWLEGIGYNITDRLHGDYIIAAEGKIYVAVIVCASKPFIDAGTNVTLFRALAAMNDENDREQWFVVKKNISDCYDIDDIIYQKGDMFFNESGEPLVEKLFRKATTEEIIEYFKKREE